ncbi:MAG: NAD-dependent deacylase [Myxococcales bacterium]|nr:NAD-dependent deacylase [Myxococcales bacterium]
MDDLERRALDILASAKRAVAFTGAGISVDSGIPDFRSAGGLWERFDPMDYAHIESFRRNPVRVWNMLREMREIVRSAKPNPGHLGLAELELLGTLTTVITQNIDALHQLAGNTRVIEFHGNSQRLVCLGCGANVDRETVERGHAEFPPRCRCGTILKPDVVFFGEQIPPAALESSWEAARRCDVMVVVGTSAVVYPAGELPILAKRAGARVIEINREPTPLTGEVADVTLLGSASDILPRLVAELRERRMH